MQAQRRQAVAIAQRGVRCLQRGAVDQPAGIGLAHRLRQRPALLRAVQRAGRVVAAQAFGVEELEELADRRQFARLRGGGKAACGDVVEIGADIGGGSTGKPAADLGRSVFEVAAIGGKRVFGGTALGAHHFEKGFDAGRAVHFLEVSFLGVQLFRRDAHAHFGLFRLDEHHQREHRTIGNAGQNRRASRQSETVSASIFARLLVLRFQTLCPYGTPIRPIQGRSWVCSTQVLMQETGQHFSGTCEVRAMLDANRLLMSIRRQRGLAS